MQSAAEDFRIAQLYRRKAKWIADKLNQYKALSVDDRIAIGFRALTTFENGGLVDEIGIREMVNEYMGT